SWSSGAQSSGPRFSRDLSRFDPPTPPTLPSVPAGPLQPPPKPVDPVQKIAPPEQMIPHTGEEEQEQSMAVAKEDIEPYDKASAFLEHCRSYRRPLSRHHVPGPWEDYNLEKPLRIKMPMTDWVRLSSDLG